VDRPVPGITRGRPDVLFPTERVAVFVDGCFWHSCQDHATVPRSNRSWWISKLRANVERDRRHSEELRSAGWEVFRYWEHDDMSEAAVEVEARVLARR
jgi:DNA mismatch endonuclease (patch repair protein)